MGQWRERGREGPGRGRDWEREGQGKGRRRFGDRRPRGAGSGSGSASPCAVPMAAHCRRPRHPPYHGVRVRACPCARARAGLPVGVRVRALPMCVRVRALPMCVRVRGLPVWVLSPSPPPSLPIFPSLFLSRSRKPPSQLQGWQGELIRWHAEAQEWKVFSLVFSLPPSRFESVRRCC